MADTNEYSVLNGTAVLRMSADGKTSKLEILPGFLPLHDNNLPVTVLDNHGIKIAAANQ